jgi:hypothetical protein
MSAVKRASAAHDDEQDAGAHWRQPGPNGGNARKDHPDCSKDFANADESDEK